MSSQGATEHLHSIRGRLLVLPQGYSILPHLKFQCRDVFLHLLNRKYLFSVSLCIVSRKGRLANVVCWPSLRCSWPVRKLLCACAVYPQQGNQTPVGCRMFWVPLALGTVERTPLTRPPSCPETLACRLRPGCRRQGPFSDGFWAQRCQTMAVRVTANPVPLKSSHGVTLLADLHLSGALLRFITALEYTPDITLWCGNVEYSAVMTTMADVVNTELHNI